jgi:hypothetical protein
MRQYGLRRAIANLKKLGLIQTARHWINQYKRVMFYHIGYERLKTFTGDGCDLITTRCVNSEQFNVQTEHTTDTDTSRTSTSEQQTVVVSEMNEGLDDIDSLRAQSCNQTSEAEVSNRERDNLFLVSSGNNFAIQNARFPELVEAVAQAIPSGRQAYAHPAASPLPTTLKRAIAPFPDPVQPSTTCDRLPKPPTAEAPNQKSIWISSSGDRGSLDLAVPQAIVPAGFSEWFDQMRAQGLVVAATTIVGVHKTLHIQQGWIQTQQLIQIMQNDSKRCQ